MTCGNSGAADVFYHKSTQQAARIAALEAWQAQATALLRQCRREAWDEYSADGAAIYARIDAFIGAPDAVTSEPDFSRYDPALE